MSYYVGAEPKNPVQCEKFWRNRIDAEEGAAVRATTAMMERSSPINWRKPSHSRPESTRSSLSYRGQEILSARNSVAEDFEKARATSRLSTASSRASSRSCRSTVLSLELEIERERRQAAEKEVEELRRQLAEKEPPVGVPRRGSRAIGASRGSKLR
ncbi:unnamed protein product [Effrenium voratum]|uniref:Uncharacterized protein n=1 Tax=Effrenium voratum TaxID=2562239 RepID=A0AA36NEA7_9DINO|nr:unnamed protein product [Effrenium voratum]CAJ1409370.1 unnamed protein product [Effrenium voratum]CAJ1446548.1 unnamed protein product [Effrenium voratum]